MAQANSLSVTLCSSILKNVHEFGHRRVKYDNKSGNFGSRLQSHLRCSEEADGLALLYSETNQWWLVASTGKCVCVCVPWGPVLLKAPIDMVSK